MNIGWQRAISNRRLLRRCRRALADLPLPQPFSAEELCGLIAEWRGRKLVLHPLPGEIRAIDEDAPCGLWVATDRADFIFYEDRTVHLHREHIIVHELAHMLLGHSMFELADPADPGAAAAILGRAGYTSRQEQEAEMLASLIVSTATNPRPRLSSGTLGQLESAMGYRGL
ncbi:hypothetical protein DFR70_12252 [Nocardia tenerifensis]|uniref:IrrE N-terminal-like domain-containing protein n=1 Tax=Nocardia tenerifensis TaxID=228006 RepID=A0A318JPV8_9NOCA|nr:hypothetical protein [Nocardia tenerifensis]PXX54911.1 hypothetical protein DFR70_12252 [Nocardia tenerifensis]